MPDAVKNQRYLIYKIWKSIDFYLCSIDYWISEYKVFHMEDLVCSTKKLIMNKYFSYHPRICEGKHFFPMIPFVSFLFLFHVEHLVVSLVLPANKFLQNNSASDWYVIARAHAYSCLNILFFFLLKNLKLMAHY